MTRFLLIRHASHDLLGRVLAGRAPDVHLNARGKMEAERLAERLAGLRIQALYTSPMERAQETAWPIAHRLGLEPRINLALHEIDFGAWTAKTFTELSPDLEWQQWNAVRSQGRATGGESMGEVQARAAAELLRLSREHSEATVALVSHGDLIKSAVLHALNLSLDAILRLEIDPASVSILQLDEGGFHLTLLNDTGLINGPSAARLPRDAALPPPTSISHR